MNEPRPIGAQLHEWRIERDMTQGDVAERLGCTVQHVSDIENGKRLVQHKEHRSPILQKIEALIGAQPATDWQATASKLDAECAKLAALAQSLRVQLADERRVSAFFEEAAHQLQVELSELRGGAVVACDQGVIVRSVAHYDH